MKYRVLELLKNPATGEPFEVKVFSAIDVDTPVHFSESRCRTWCHKNDVNPRTVTPRECESCYRREVMDGVLIGKQSGQRFPIIDGIPRVLPTQLLQEQLSRRHPEWLAKYRSELGATSGLAYDVEPEKKATAKNFGYQWTTFVDNFDYFKEIFLSFTRPYLDEHDFKGKLMLEIGCGSGRPAVTACRLGAEVVAVDISDGVETVFRKSLSERLLHVIQGDAYAPPLTPSFDVVYSVGVLQHIASPKKALEGMYTVVSPRSPLVLWIYGKRELWYQPVEWLRRLTSRIPPPVLHPLAILLAVWSEIFLLIPYRVMSKIPFLKRVAEKIPGRIYARFPFRENVVGWFDRLGAPVTYYFSKDDIVNLLKTTGFANVEVAVRKEASASWVVRAHRAEERTQAQRLKGAQ